MSSLDEHWLKRAEEISALAEQMKDMASKEVLLRIAADCERTAKRLADQARESPHSK
jgi:molecular chaperone GrpE (heat shock protein)